VREFIPQEVRDAQKGYTRMEHTLTAEMLFELYEQLRRASWTLGSGSKHVPAFNKAEDAVFQILVERNMGDEILAFHARLLETLRMERQTVAQPVS
jgi:hypothetical protein